PRQTREEMAAAIPRNLFLKDRSTKTSRLRAALHAPGPASTSMDSGTKDSKKTSVSWSSKYKQKAKQSKATATGSEDNSATQRRILLSSCPKTESRQALPSLKKEKPSLKKVCPMNNAVKPTNVTEEKIKFYNSKYTYNPQFKYNTPVPPCIPVKHRNASDGFLQVAVELMQNTLKRYGTYNGYEKATGGHALPKHLIEKQVQMYLETEGLHGKIDVCITKEMLASASMGIKKGKPRLTINQSTVRERWLEGTLRHEIGTHYYRSVNHSRQLWKRDEERFRLKPKNPTEEGFATLNTVLRHPEPYLCRIALLYYAAYKASCMSFSELFKDLGTFVKDPDTRWHYCLRVKRGLTDTSRPGCYSKDQVYLDGVLRILRHRQTIDFKLLMAMGKISFEDINRLKHMAVRKGTKIPDFLKDTRQYMNHLNNIMKVNRLTDEKLKKLIP
uniref:KIAA0895 n=1 Tax=Leptobrachium leishanense TaxID=445787 RepID=A0A8C5M682_9ANUR